MQLALVGYVAFMAACGIVGGRLLGRGLRERLLPEAALGFGFLCSGCVGYLLAILPAFAPGLSPELRQASSLAAAGVIDAGFLGLLCFMLRVFGGGRLAVRALALGTGSALLAALALAAASGGDANLDPASAPYWLHFGARTFAFLWVGVEGSRQALQMRRRLALGLVEPVVANRFWLFAGFGFSAAAMSLTITLGSIGAVPGETRPAVALGASAFGFAAAVWMWLAFFPPAAYRAWVSRRAAVALSAR